MKIGAINSFNNLNFSGKTRENQNSGQVQAVHDKENPISKPLEQLDVVKASLLAGLGFGARALYYVYDDTDLFEATLNAGQKLANKNYKHLSSNKRMLLGLASGAAIIVGLIGLLAGVYALYNAPKSLYQGKVNAHKKAEEMDVYLAGNRLEKDLYTEVSKSAKVANTKQEQEKAKEQYMKLRMAKNDIPSFISDRVKP